MRVVFSVGYYPPYSVGGAEQSTFALARALRARGHDVRVLAPRLGPRPPEGGVPVDLVDVGAEVVEPGRPLPPRTFESPRVQARFFRAARRAARNADVVHAQTLDLLPAVWAAGRSARVPVVASIRDLGGICPVSVSLLDGPRVPADCGMLKLQRECVPRFAEIYGGPSRARLSAASAVRFLTMRGRSRLLDRCAAVVSVGSDLGLVYADAGLIDRERIVHIPNIAELDEVAAADPLVEGDFALFAGKVSPGKGVAQLLDAVAATPGLRLVVAGRAEPRWAARLQSAERVVALGRIPRAQLAGLYRAARFTVVPSIWPEPFPRAAIESLFAGTPVVATTAGGIPDAIRHGETGLLVPPRDAPALAAAMRELWGDPGRGRAMGEAGRRDVTERFSAERVSARVEALYEGLR